MQRLNSLKREAVVLKRHGGALQVHVSWGGGAALGVGTGSAGRGAVFRGTKWRALPFVVLFLPLCFWIQRFSWLNSSHPLGPASPPQNTCICGALSRHSKTMENQAPGDTNAFFTSKNVIDLSKNVNQYLSSLSLWLRQNELQLKPAKTEYVMFSPINKPWLQSQQ